MTKTTITVDHDTKTPATLRVALVSDVFVGDDAAARLRSTLLEAKAEGAEFAVLPEIPLNHWAPATKEVCDDDAEGVKGWRYQIQAEAAATVGIGLLGGGIVIDPATGTRYNTSLVFDAAGAFVGSFRKCHVPEEPGFWETSHYAAGAAPSEIFTAGEIRFGIQICSDINRPQGALTLAAGGADAVFNPRATELATTARWRVVFQALAITSGAYILSVNRPEAEAGVLIGGPSVVIDPLGEVLVDSCDRITFATIERAKVRAARSKYPGYLPVRSDLYAKAWGAVRPIHGYDETDW